MMKSIALFASLTWPNLSDSIHTSHSVLYRIAIVESGGSRAGQFAVGDRGASRGAWQMKRGSWQDVSKARKKAGLGVCDSKWEKGACDPDVARIYATTYLEILRTQFIAEFGKSPSEDQLYLAWILGYHGASKRGWTTDGLPPRIQAKIDKFRATK